MSGDKPKDCIFCRPVPEEMLHRGDHAYVILNAYPYNPGHLMVIPFRHVGSLAALQEAEAAEIMDITRRCIRVLERAMSPNGLNIGVNEGEAAGAGIAGHVHQHVVPRWVGDTNFMTSVGHAKVLPEMVTETFAKLAPLFAEEWR